MIESREIIEQEYLSLLLNESYQVEFVHLSQQNLKMLGIEDFMKALLKVIRKLNPFHQNMFQATYVSTGVKYLTVIMKDTMLKINFIIVKK